MNNFKLGNCNIVEIGYWCLGTSFKISIYGKNLNL